MRSDLTMPPDLRLPQPGTTAAAPDPGAMSNEAALAAPPPLPARTASQLPPHRSQPGHHGGRQHLHPGGHLALQAGRHQEVRLPSSSQELQAYYIAQKKAKNPNYGTVFNIGNIFKDE